MPSAPRILIIKTSSLGDLFHALPAVHILKRKLGAQIDWVTNSEYADLVACFSDVERVIPFPRRNLAGRDPAGRLKIGRFLRELRSRKYNLIVDMQGLFKSALIGRCARLAAAENDSFPPAIRLGPSFEREGARFLYSAVAGPKDKERHAVRENLDIVSFLNLPPEQIRFPLNFPGYSLPKGGKRVALIPCSRHAAKNWPAENFVSVGRGLAKRAETEIWIAGAPDDKQVGRAIADGIGACATNLAGETTLVELGGLLSKMDLVISVDSGPMHMASALGRATLALFGPTDPQRVGPFGDRNRVLRAPLATQSRSRSGNYSDKDLETIKRLDPERVLKIAKEMLNEN